MIQRMPTKADEAALRELARRFKATEPDDYEQLSALTREACMLTEPLAEHPSWWEWGCLCAECCSYGDPVE